MNTVALEIKRKEKFGWYQTSQRRYQIKVFAGNMTKEQADKFEAGIRKLSLSILPVKEDKDVFG
jgi:hypothetical protein